MPRRVKLAISLAFCLHGILILTGQYRLSYDAYNHMFFADHYLRNWWSLWEPRWYTGFEVTSYPPLVHQFMALLGRLTGVEAAYALALWAVLAAYPLAIYGFSRIFTGRTAASYAALGAALLPSLYLSAHTFGQLPSLACTMLALFAAVALASFLRNGDLLSGALAVSLSATAMAGHHATLLAQPWLAGAVLLHSAWQQKGNRLQPVLRFLAYGTLAALAALAVVWPFWEWGRHQAMQTPIDHLSRHNFFRNPFAAGLFFLPMYGLLIPFIPVGLWIGLRKRYWGLGIVFLLMFLLGLGDTTPLPRLFFGEGWAWLTYDRFAFSASLTLLPLLGVAAVWLRRSQTVRRSWPYFGSLMGLTGLLIGAAPAWLPTQPRPVDMQPIVAFLGQADHGQYRYVTFGFGDQLAFLSLLTEATTIDGSYHTARTLPELRTSGIGQIDTAFWFSGGMSALDPILQKAGERGVRWGFVNLKFYAPVLERNGWVYATTLANGVEVWENPAATRPPPVWPVEKSPFTSFSWGTFPLLALFISTGLAMRRYRPSASLRVLTTVKAVAIGLLPLGLTLWYFRRLFAIEQPRIYFVYSDALFFLADGLALVAVLAWLILRLRPPGEPARPAAPLRARQFITGADSWLFGLCLLASMSTFWSLEWRTSLYISAHLWLCFGLYIVLRDTPEAWRWFALGCCAALALQFIAGGWQFISQSTAETTPPGWEWPGDLDPATRGVSVVQLADGTRWLRAYGTTPHPNLLGGFAVAMLAAPLALFLRPARPSHLLPVILFNVTLVLVVLTFSRSAWLGLAIFSAWLFVHWKQLNHKTLVLLAATGLATLAFLFVFLQPLFMTRLGGGQAQTERVSSYTRLWLIQRTAELIQKYPLAGTGIGSFSLALSRHVADFYQIEPVHSVPLLAASELGIGGVVLLGGLAATLATGALKARRPAAIVLSAALLGLLAASLFDHYLWTLAPGRLLLATLLGLWAGQVRADARADESRG